MPDDTSAPDIAAKAQEVTTKSGDILAELQQAVSPETKASSDLGTPEAIADAIAQSQQMLEGLADQVAAAGDVATTEPLIEQALVSIQDYRDRLTAAIAAGEAETSKLQEWNKNRAAFLERKKQLQEALGHADTWEKYFNEQLNAKSTVAPQEASEPAPASEPGIEPEAVVSPAVEVAPVPAVDDREVQFQATVDGYDDKITNASHEGEMERVIQLAKEALAYLEKVERENSEKIVALQNALQLIAESYTVDSPQFEQAKQELEQADAWAKKVRWYGDQNKTRLQETIEAASPTLSAIDTAPVEKAVDQGDIVLSASLKEAIEKAKAGEMSPEEYFQAVMSEIERARREFKDELANAIAEAEIRKTKQALNDAIAKQPKP